MNEIRREKIKEYVLEKGVVTIQDLRKVCPDVSVMTIHRDLDVLEREGTLVKVRGGAKAAVYASETGFEIRLHENTKCKQLMAEKALPLIQNNSSIFLDAGTSNLILARHMPDMNIDIFTTAPNIALELCRLNHPVITCCCGTVNRRNLAVSGMTTLDMIDKINIDLAFVGVSGTSPEAGFTCGSESEMLVKQLVIRKARKSVVMCDSSKLQRVLPYTFATFSEVDLLISDGKLPDPYLEFAKSQGVNIL